MLKPYHVRETTDKTVTALVSAVDNSKDPDSDTNLNDLKSDIHLDDVGRNTKLQNSHVLSNLEEKLCHLSPSEQSTLTQLINNYTEIFSDTPGYTNLIQHDVDVGDHSPIKQHPYRVSPAKLKLIHKEIKYMLDHNIIEPSMSDWSSPCLLVPKSDGTYRFCTDFRKVNSVTKTDSFPIPRIDDCIDKIGCAQYISKFDLLKGYWQVPLTARAKEVSAFAVPDAFFQYRTMPFGMKNSSATFQRLVNNLVRDIDNCEAYVDDIVVFSKTWPDHIEQVKKLFDCLREANLTVNLVKTEFGKARVTFLGYLVGQGELKPIQAKVEAIAKFPVPSNKRELKRFLGVIGYYRKFCRNFSDIVSVLTNLLCKNATFIWSNECQVAFEKIKSMLQNSPILKAPNFEQQFKLYVDASDLGAGAMLAQDDANGIDHPICYFSKKFDKHQKNYSTIEKEALALILALSHFNVYVESSFYPVLVFTDHNPLTFINKMKNRNQRLLRWSLALQEYNLDIRYVRGRDNIIADALSRVV